MTSLNLDAPLPIAYSVAAAVAATGGAISRMRMFELIRDGQIDAKRVSRRTLITAASLRRFIESAPSARPTATHE